MDQVSVAVFDKWPQLFFDYGPFFIVLVLMLVVARQVTKNLQTAIATNSGEPNIRYWRCIVAGVWIFTAGMLIVTVVWWVQNRDTESIKAYVVRIDITDAQPTDVLEPFSDELFYRNRDPLDALRRKDTFIAVAERPFRTKQQLEIVHKKGADAATGVRYAIPLDDGILKERFAAFKLALNEKGKYELVALANPARHTAGVIGTAFAMQPSQVIPGQPIALPQQPAPAIQVPSQVRSVPAPDFNRTPRGEDAAATLLNEASSIYRQVQALDALIHAADEGARPNLFQRRGNSDETLLSYLITLSHHQDRLLAYKAQALLKRVDHVGAVAKVAGGRSGQPQEIDRRILSSLPAGEWDGVEQRMRKDGLLVGDASVDRRRGSSPLPSATTDGTEYYALTTWASLNRDQASCLSKVVFRQGGDVADPSPADALGFVQTRKGFPVSFKTKSEAVVFADAARKCGANTEFVYKGDKKLANFRD